MCIASTRTNHFVAQSLKLVLRLRVDENERMRTSAASAASSSLNSGKNNLLLDETALSAHISALEAELARARLSADMPPAAIDWCLRFMLLQARARGGVIFCFFVRRNCFFFSSKL